MKNKMKTILCLIALCALIATLHAAQYSWPTFKANLVQVDPFTNKVLTSQYYCDATKKIIRYESSNAIQRYIQFVEPTKFTVITYTIGNDQSIVCNTAKTDNSVYFGNLLEGGTYLGLKALNSTIGLAYNVPKFLGQVHATYVIDSFTNYPALVTFEKKEYYPAVFTNAAELTAAESNALFSIPKEITCKDVTNTRTTGAQVKIFRF